MAHDEHIRTAHRVYGKKIREITRETGHSKNTVKKALRHEYCGSSQGRFQPYAVLGPYMGIIDEWLKRDKEQPKKHRHSAHRLYDRLSNVSGMAVTGFTDAKRRSMSYLPKNVSICWPCLSRALVIFGQARSK